MARTLGLAAAYLSNVNLIQADEFEIIFESFARWVYPAVAEEKRERERGGLINFPFPRILFTLVERVQPRERARVPRLTRI